MKSYLNTNPDYPAQSALIAEVVSILQPRNGADYSDTMSHWTRAQIALNIHHGRPVLEGVDA